MPGAIQSVGDAIIDPKGAFVPGERVLVHDILPAIIATSCPFSGVRCNGEIERLVPADERHPCRPFGRQEPRAYAFDYNAVVVAAPDFADLAFLTICGMAAAQLRKG